ncbi:MAG TPA: hypothetical protein VHZ55_08835 [Bryobacteraceae bacterium]|nr:hypothetical protein [Bryobacteraceae bacterium]
MSWHRAPIIVETSRGGLRAFRGLFVNAVNGRAADVFDFGIEQVGRLTAELLDTRRAGLRPPVFTH